MCLYAYTSVGARVPPCSRGRAHLRVAAYLGVSPRASDFEVWVSEFTICNAQLILSACIYRGIEHLLKWAWLCHSLLDPL